MEYLLKIEGMSCQHCVMRVKKTLEGVKGVLSAQVEIGSAKVSCSDCKKEELIEAISKVGYRVTNVSTDT